MKKYTLKTISDIEKVLTKDNIECFKKDFCAYLDLLVLAKQESISTYVEIPNKGTFNWIDDGKNDIKINIEVKED